MKNILQKRIDEKFVNEDITVLEYSDMKNPATVRCNKCNKIYNLKRAENFIRKGKVYVCRPCTKASLGKVEFQKRINLKYPKENLKVITYSLQTEPCTIKCEKCGSEFSLEQARFFIDKDKKRVCKKCFPNKNEIISKTIEQFQNFIKDNKDFELIDQKELDNIQAKALISCKCKHCGRINYKTMYDYMRGRGCYCQTKNEKLTAEQYQNRLGEEYTLISDYKGLEHSVMVKHNLCGFCYKTNARHYHCPKCSGSKGEKTIAFYLEKANEPYQREKIEVIEGHKLRFDFYLPKRNLYIEYQGEQHFYAKDYFGGEAGLKKQQYYDKIKKDWCKENYKNLLIINYDEDIQKNLLKFNDYPEREYTVSD